MHPKEHVRRLNSHGHRTPPELPKCWRATVLLFPFGDSREVAEQLFVADVEYNATSEYREMAFHLSGTQTSDSLTAIVRSTDSENCVSIVDEGPNGELVLRSSSRSTLVVPRVDFVSDKCNSAGMWEISGAFSFSWVSTEPDGQPFGSWYSFGADGESLWRVFNIDCKNQLSIPLLGSFSIAYFDDWSTDIRLIPKLRQFVAEKCSTTGEPFDLVTQRDLFRELRESRQDAPQFPGFGLVGSPGSYPQWGDYTYAVGWAIGLDLIPYSLELHYAWPEQRQQAAYTGLAGEAGEGNYDTKFVARSYDDRTEFSTYLFDETEWTHTGDLPQLAIGPPRPNYLATAEASRVGEVMGNDRFGLIEAERLEIFRVSLPRSEEITSFFWLMFVNGQALLFMECEFADEPQHLLQLIDYEVFDTNALDRIELGAFDETVGSELANARNIDVSRLGRVLGCEAL